VEATKWERAFGRPKKSWRAAVPKMGLPGRNFNLAEIDGTPRSSKNLPVKSRVAAAGTAGDEDEDSKVAARAEAAPGASRDVVATVKVRDGPGAGGAARPHEGGVTVADSGGLGSVSAGTTSSPVVRWRMRGRAGNERSRP